MSFILSLLISSPQHRPRRSASVEGLYEPGMMVRHPARPDWGLGQVQSAIGHRVTVNFEEAGKVVIDMRAVDLVPVFD
jgi:hypothetical protein